ncbi:arylsulfatase I-like [Rhopilema esculentum]|uniref:arylsulfatase I-like n=1 Tax=Rhopilema esculentum TaxID=499914 RepID=UPI0031E27152|eukprot:gene11395-21593_t
MPAGNHKVGLKFLSKNGKRMIMEQMFILGLVLSLVNSGSCSGHRLQPHIILVVLRDLGWDDVSFHGNAEIPTPNIDRIANHGVILQDYYVTPRCEDSVSALKTGKHPINYRPGQQFSYDMWNYLDIQQYVIREAGMIDCSDTPIPFYPWDAVREAEYILRDHDQYYPLFLQVNFPQMRADYPGQVPPEYLARAANIMSEPRQVFAGMVMELDKAVGHLVRLLYDTKILHDAIVFFTTLTGATQNNNIYTYPSNYPLKGGNGTMWEGGSRALGFVYSNRITQKARVTHGLVHITDWLPTFFSLAGGNPQHIVEGDGFDVWNLIDSEAPSPRNDILYGIYGDRGAVRVADHKVIVKEKSVMFYLQRRNKQGPNAPTTVWDAELQCSVTNVSIGCWPEVEPCLFNVRQDPCEMNNLAYYYPDLVKTMLYTLNKYNDTAKYKNRKRRSVTETTLYQETVAHLDKSVKKRERMRRTSIKP